MSSASWFRQAITGSDNETIEPSWLIGMWAVFVILPGVIMLLTGIAVVDVYFNHHEASVGALGGGIAAVIGAVASFVASCALMLRQDRAPAAVPAATTTTRDSTTTTTVVPAAAPDLAIAQGESAPQPSSVLTPKIVQADVGSSVAIERPRTRRRK